MHQVLRNLKVSLESIKCCVFEPVEGRRNRNFYDNIQDV